MKLNKVQKKLPFITWISKPNLFDLKVPAQFTTTTLFPHSPHHSFSKCLESPC